LAALVRLAEACSAAPPKASQCFRKGDLVTRLGHPRGFATMKGITGKIWTNPITGAYLNDKRQENKDQE
jgi:hypothetical protein